MNLKTIRIFIVCVFSLLFLPAVAQDEYKAEIGIIGGGSYYLGDANSVLFGNIQPTYGGFFRYRINPRIALKGEFTSATIAGSGFINPVYVGDMSVEFNFFDLEIDQYKRFSKKYSTYIFTGVGFMTDLYTGQLMPEPSLPFGIGMKIKLKNRWNLNAQWSHRLLLNSDQMENTPAFNNPNGLNGSNIFRNDLLSSITVGLSFDIWEKPCDCKNNNYKRR